MPEFDCKFADMQGQVHQRVETWSSEEELRSDYAARRLLLYSVRPHRPLTSSRVGERRGRLNLEQFVIFNQQFVTLTRAGLPILRSLELLAENTKHRHLASYLNVIHENVRTGMSLSEAFRSQGVFPPIYTTSLFAGEKSGSLPEVIDRYIQYQKLSLSVRKKILVSLIYPTILVALVIAMVIFLVTFVVPEFAELYDSMGAQLPYMTQLLVSIGVTLNTNLVLIGAVVVGIVGILTMSLRSERARDFMDHVKLKIPFLGQIWIKYQVSQFCRLLSTLLTGGIPLVQALETTGQSLDSRLLQKQIKTAREMVTEGQLLSESLATDAIFPSLAIEMVQVGESTGALPEMLNSVAEFFDDDVSTHMAAVLSLIEPAIMIFMGIFVAFVLISLYLPIFSLAERI
jgi:type IV pilus assembly protein PilC